jgi:hypothetical protein
MSLEFALGMERHVRGVFQGFAELMPALSRAFPDHAVVLRPHPSEDHDEWRRITAGLDNVQVLHDGNVVPWLMACDVLLHNGCTTAVEGTLLGTPAVAYRPVQADCYDYHLPNNLSLQTFTEDATLDAVADIVNARRAAIEAGERLRVLSRHVTFGSDTLAAERIVEVLAADGYLEQSPPPPSPLRRLRSWFGTQFRTGVKRFNRLRPHHRNSEQYLRHRFPPLMTEDVERRLQSLRERLNRFDGIRARPVGPDLFAIERADRRVAVS